MPWFELLNFQSFQLAGKGNSTAAELKQGDDLYRPEFVRERDKSNASGVEMERDESAANTTSAVAVHSWGSWWGMQFCRKFR